MAIYTVTGPDGLSLKVEGDAPPSESELDEIFGEAQKRFSPVNTPRLDGPSLSAYEPSLWQRATRGLREAVSPLIGPTDLQQLERGAILESAGPAAREGILPALHESFKAPAITLPQMDAGADSPITRGILQTLAPNIPPEASAAGINALGGLASGMTSPYGLLAVGASPLAGAAGRAAIGAGFGVPMALEVPEAAREAGRLSVEGTPQESADALAQLGSAIVLPAAIAGGVAGDMRSRPLLPDALRRDSGIVDLKTEPTIKSPQIDSSVIVDPKAESAAAEMTLAADIAKADGPTFRSMVMSESGRPDPTGVAYRIGDAVTTLEQLDQLRAGRTEASSQLEASIAAGQMDMALTTKPQFFREAVERATKSGSADATTPDTAPLNYRTHPEVAEWLVKHRKELGLSEDAVAPIRESLAKPESTPTTPATPSAETPPTPAPAAEPAMTEVGLGGARPGQFTPPDSGPTSIKNAVVTQERISREIEPAVQAAKRSFGTVWDDALAVVEKDPSKQDALISQLRENPRALTDTEDALILHRQIDLQNEYGKAARDLNQAHEDGRLGDVDREQARVDYLSDQLLDIYNIGKASGTETGRGLNARKMLANQDFTLAEMETKARAAKGGRKLTDEEKTKLKNTSEKIEKTQKELDEHLDTKGDQAADETLSKIEKDARKEPTDTSEQQGVVGEKIRAKVEAGDQDISSLVQRLARLFVESGVRERNALVTAVHDVLKDIDPGFTRRDTMDAISGYGRFKPLSKDEVSVTLRDLKGQMQQVAKLEDIQAKQPLQKTGVERRTPSDEERRLIQQVNEAKRKYGVIVTDPATQLRSALQQAKTFLTNRLSDLRQEIAARERNVKTKTPLKPDAELEALRKEYELVKAEHAEMFPKREMTDEQRVAIAEKVLDRSIAKLESDLDAGKLKRDVVPSRTPQTESIVEKKAWLEALREHRQELIDLSKPKKTPEEIALQSLKSRLTRSVAEYERKLREGDFSPRKPATVDISNDPVAIRLKTENERLKAEFQRGLDLDRLRRRTRGQKIYGGVKEAVNLPRNILSSWDVSAVLRQGGFIGLGNPVRAAKSIIPMFKSLASERAALELEQQILARPNAKDYAASKLYLAPQDSIRLSAQEEQIMSRLAGKIPGIRASNRAFVSFLNKLRADSFDAMKSSVESRGESLKPDELKAISNYINVATGRGNLGKAAAAAETMATVFFSPRLMASRFQLLAGEPLYRGSARTRTAIATEYAKTLVGLAAIYALGSLSGAELEDDPRSSDFGKLKFGNTRVDPLMGLAQATVLLSRLASGETKTLKGAVVPIRGEKIPYGGSSAADVIARFLRSKLSPVVGAGVNIASGENVVGEPVTAGSVAQDLLIPLSFQDIQEIMIEQGIPAGTALEILQLFGMGLQHHESKK